MVPLSCLQQDAGSGEGALNGGNDEMGAAWDNIAETQVCFLDCSNLVRSSVETL